MTIHRNRPLSPHLQVYRLPLTGLISITHRVTGVFLSIGLIGMVYILHITAEGPLAFQSLQAFLNMTIVKVIYWGFIYALCFHLCHGIRHLIWDGGSSFEKKTMDYYAGIELMASVLLTVAVLLLT